MVDERNLNIANSSADSEEYIDLRDFQRLILRNKKLFFIVTVFFTAISIISAYNTQKVWKGNLQIVLSKESSNYGSNSPFSNLITGLSGQSNINSDVNTQVEILKSNYVLKPAFEFYKLNLPKNENNIRFDKWSKKNLKVDLIKFTNVLDVSLEDTDKELIIKVLDKISKDYQNFSSKEKQKGLKNGIDFLESQIGIYKERVESSRMKEDKYSRDYGIYIVSSLPSITSSVNLNSNSNSTVSQTEGGASGGGILTTNIESNDRKLSSEINNLTNELKRIKEINIDEKSKVSSIIPNNKIKFMDTFGFLSEGIADIKNLEKNIEFKETYYTNNDEQLKSLIELKVNKLIDFKNSMIAYLESLTIQKQIEQKNNFKEVSKILKYKELVRSSKRDESTLSGLEEMLRTLKLEIKRNKDPWKIITDPTIEEFPVKPIKRQYAIRGAFFGLLFSFIASFLYEKKLSLLYNEEKIKKILQIEKVCSISSSKLPSDLENILLFLEGTLKIKTSDSLSIIYVGEEQEEFTKFLINGISNFYQKENILITDNFRNAFKKKNQIVVCFCGKNKTKTFEEFKTKINLFGSKPSGLLIIREN